MIIKDLINRAYMQVGDTSQVNYTPYQFLEFYNEGNHILHKIVLWYIPDILRVTETGVPNRPTIALSSFALQIISVKDMYGNPADYTMEGHKIITAKSAAQRGLTVVYIPSADYKEMDDESGYPAEIESLLVNYMVARILKADLSFVSGWEDTISEMARQMNDESGFIARGYWSYDCGRIDYDD